MKAALAPGMRPNPGYCPEEARGRRVVVQLACGVIDGREPITATSPAGWPADGSGACRWTIRNERWDIAGYQVLR